MSAIGSVSHATSLAQAQLAGQIGLAVARTIQDTAKAQGEAALSLLHDAAAMANRSPSEAGKGVLIDIDA